MIQTLIAAGTDPEKIHLIEHHFICTDKQALIALMAKGNSLGYRPSHIQDLAYKGEKSLCGDLYVGSVLDLELINQENVRALELAHEFGVEYDGWATWVVK